MQNINPSTRQEKNQKTHQKMYIMTSEATVLSRHRYKTKKDSHSHEVKTKGKIFCALICNNKVGNLSNTG